MRYVWVCGFVLLFAVGARATEPQPAGVVVHEWGIFHVYEDVEMANADMLAEWRDLPDFVYGQVNGRVLPVNWGATERRLRPIIFFHAAETTQVRLKIDFPGGMPGVWFPGTEIPSQLGNGKPPPIGSSLVWNLGIKNPPLNRQVQRAGPPPVPRDHWIARVRQVRSDEVFAVFGDGINDVDREKFVYYDGLFPQGKWLRIQVVRGEVRLTSQVKFPVHDVTVVDCRDPSKPRIGRLARLEAGAENREIDCVAANPATFADDNAAVLVKQLTAAGLFEDEALSLVDLRKKELFETTGLHVFYRIPQAEYEKRLPMTLTPLPRAVVRVGLIYHGHCEPDLAERVLALAKQLDSDEFAVREKAQKELESMGRAAYVHLVRLRKSPDLPLEVRKRVDALLEKWDAQMAFPG
jgi:hypothetical protein